MGRVIAGAAVAAALGAVAVGTTVYAASPADGPSRHQQAIEITRKPPSLRTQVLTLRKDLAALKKQVSHLSRTAPVGPTGPAGPQGPAGPTAGAFATTRNNVSLNPAGTPVRVMSVSSEGGGPIRMPVAGRIFTTATVVAGTTNGGAGRVFCWFVLGQDPNGTQFSQDGIADVPATTNATSTVPVVGSVAVAAGTYDVSTVCLLNGPGALSTFHADMVAWGIPS